MNERILLFAWAMSRTGWPCLLPHSEILTRKTYQPDLSRVYIKCWEGTMLRRYQEAA